MHLQAKLALPDPWRKPSATKGVLLGAQRASMYLAKSRMSPSAAGHGTRSVQPRVLRGGSRLGILSKTFGRRWSSYFPNNFLETHVPHWHMRYSQSCGYVRMLFQTSSAESRANKERQMHGDTRSKNNEITYLQGCTVQEQTYNPYSIFSWKTIK